MITVLIYYPKTIPEELYLTIIMIFNCGVFGYTINECNILYNNFIIIFNNIYIFIHSGEYFKWYKEKLRRTEKRSKGNQ